MQDPSEACVSYVRRGRPTFYKIWRKKAVEDFSPIPYLATFLNCMMWIFYGIPVVHPHSLLVVTINGTGLALETIYLIIFLLYSTPSGRVTTED